jgi:hypothetical protein
MPADPDPQGILEMAGRAYGVEIPPTPTLAQTTRAIE